jgi:hypothetical protein
MSFPLIKLSSVILPRLKPKKLAIFGHFREVSASKRTKRRVITVLKKIFQRSFLLRNILKNLNYLLYFKNMFFFLRFGSIIDSEPAYLLFDSFCDH